MRSTALNNEPWQYQSVCAEPGVLDEYSTNPFDVGWDNIPEAKKLAEKFCANCPVTLECTEWAKAAKYKGVAAGRLWGGRGAPGGRPLLPVEPRNKEK